ncbi:protein of unknown function [Microbacterium sp. Nx66]|nr:protein of unknown function [Microbacterium sp. Nx66]
MGSYGPQDMFLLECRLRLWESRRTGGDPFDWGMIDLGRSWGRVSAMPSELSTCFTSGTSICCGTPNSTATS